MNIMKNVLIICFSFIIFHFSLSQTIPYGDSRDSLTVYYDYDTIKYNIFYYKPANYDPNSSPILFGVHGMGGTGTSIIIDIKTIADRRKALIIAPTMPELWYKGMETTCHLYTVQHYFDSICCNYYWLNTFMKQIYRNVLKRENRINMDMYLTGFSAGGQFVTRYMLIRQGHPDSIPIKMAVSVNPYYYTFCTDSLNGIQMNYPCGIWKGITQLSYNCHFFSGWPSDTVPLGFTCDEHVLQYYNENYAVLIGTADSVTSSISSCVEAQGGSRYERAKNFFNFSSSDAFDRGTYLQWKYGEVPGVDHSGIAMYNTSAAGDSIPIAERLIFDLQWHPVPQLVPVADFTADSTVVYLPNATVDFTNNSTNTVSYEWDFGDSTTSTAINPSHTYLYADTFTVALNAVSSSGCSKSAVKNKYIIVKNKFSIENLSSSNGGVLIYPNPAKETLNIISTEKGEIHIYNILGEEVIMVNRRDVINHVCTINVSNLSEGTYIVKYVSEKSTITRKLTINN